MDPRIAHSIFQALRGDRFAFAYSGAFHDEHTARLISLGEEAILEKDARASTRGRLAFVMVEAYQNILRHRAPLPPQVEQGEGRSLFILRCQGDGQQVVAVNPVKKADVLGLRQTLHRLHGMDPSQLKSLFLSGLQKDSNGPRRGAGLGLIEMTRRSGSDLGYMLRGLGEEHELFILAVRMGAERPYAGILSDAAVLHGTVVQQDIVLVHTGERTVGIQEAVLRMVEEDGATRTESAIARGRAYLAGMGCLRDLATEQAGDDQQSGRWIFGLSRDNGHFSMAIGRLVARDTAQRIAESIGRVNGMDRSELERHYRNALLKRSAEGDNADLLELARISVEPLDHATFPVDDGELVVVRAMI